MLETAALPSLQTQSQGLRRSISNVLYQRRTLTLLLILVPPLLWFGVVYVGSMLTLLSQSVFTFDEMTMSVINELTTEQLHQPAESGESRTLFYVPWVWPLP